MRKILPSAFTLIELLSVMAIMVILLAIALGVSTDWGRSAGMRSSVLGVKSALAMARQWAVTYRVRTTFAYTNTSSCERGYYVVFDTENGNVGNTNYLARDIVFTNNLTPIEFELDGSCQWRDSGDDSSTRAIVLLERHRGNNRLISTITVFRVTGYARAEQ